MMFPTVYNKTLYPFVSKYNKEQDRLNQIIKQSVEIMTLIGAPIILGGLFLAESIFLTVYSPSFAAGIPVFKLLIISIGPVFFNKIFSNILLATNKQNICVVISGISLTINIILNLLFIPTFGIIGAAIGTLITRIIFLILSLYALKKLIPLKQIFQFNNLIYIFYSILMLTGIHLSSLITQQVFILILIGAIIYTSLLIITKNTHILKLYSIINSNNKNNS